MARKRKKPRLINWNKWHDIMIDALQAFEIDEALRVAKALDYRSQETDGMELEVSAGGMVDFITHACKWLILRYEEKWDGKTEVERDAYTQHAYLDDTGAYVAALDLSSSYPPPTLEVSLIKTVDGEEYFRIQVVSASQMF